MASSVTFSGNGLLTVCRRKASGSKREEWSDLRANFQQERRSFFRVLGGSVFLLATGKQIVFLRQEKENCYEKALGEGMDDPGWGL